MAAFSGDSEASRERRGNGTPPPPPFGFAGQCRDETRPGTLVPGGRSRVSLGTVIDGLSFPIPERHPKATRCFEGVRDTRSFGRCFVPAFRSQCTSRACARSPVRRRTPRTARNPPSRCRRRRAQGVLAASLRPTASGTSLRFPTPSLVESGSSSDSATMGCTTSKQDVMTDVARQESSRSIDSTLAGVDISALPRKTFTAGNPQRVRRAFDPRPTWLFASSTRSGHASQKSASHRSSVCQWPQNPASRPPSTASD